MPWAAYLWYYGNGKDEYGRAVTNPAGFVLTLAAAKSPRVARTLQRQGKLKVYVHYPWAI